MTISLEYFYRKKIIFWIVLALRYGYYLEAIKLTLIKSVTALFKGIYFYFKFLVFFFLSLLLFNFAYLFFIYFLNFLFFYFF